MAVYYGGNKFFKNISIRTQTVNVESFKRNTYIFKRNQDGIEQSIVAVESHTSPSSVLRMLKAEGRNRGVFLYAFWCAVGGGSERGLRFIGPLGRFQWWGGGARTVLVRLLFPTSSSLRWSFGVLYRRYGFGEVFAVQSMPL